MNGATYVELERKQPSTVRDHTGAWDRLTPIGSAGDDARAAITRFCESKRIAFAALEQLGTRVTHRGDIGYCLAYAGSNGNGKVVAIKYRPLSGSSHDSFTERPSVWLRPIVIGDPSSLNWLVAEGETDGARLYELVGDSCAILVLPTGARAFKREWADVIPRGATVALCHDADEDGDAGAEKAAGVIGGRTVRVRPPVDGSDWCDWSGDREGFAVLVQQAARARAVVLPVVSARELCERPDPEHHGELLGPLLVSGARTIVLGHTGAGKSTLISHMVASAATGAEFLDWMGAGGKALIVDLEQSEADAKRMLRQAGLALSEDVAIALVPDGLELHADDAQLAALEQTIVDGGYAIVVFDPYYKAHRAEDSNAERQIDDLMRRLDGLRARYGFALVLGAHPRKPPVGANPPLTIHDLAGSGAAVRGAETILAVERVSDGYSRLRFLKDRPSRLPVGDAWGLLFDRETGYRRDPSDGKTRDVRAELLGVLAGGEWWTITDLRRPKAAGGVGANPDKLRPELNSLTSEGLVECAIGPPGRSKDAKCWRVSRGLQDTRDTPLFLAPPVNGEGRGVSVSHPLRGDTPTDTATESRNGGVSELRDTPDADGAP